MINETTDKVADPTQSRPEQRDEAMGVDVQQSRVGGQMIRPEHWNHDHGRARTGRSRSLCAWTVTSHMAYGGQSSAYLVTELKCWPFRSSRQPRYAYSTAKPSKGDQDVRLFSEGE